ncbi:mandelate racemase/muconate lactonizing enzyme family protein [Kiloniella sp. b19]|uniref:mandelate racemase/muconate lactonizing enzyme family protein n=1 Tax=Kiloniella sp. GXU_MW_B19 TaxID=3141326 RepID=UPI0031E2E2E6
MKITAIEMYQLDLPYARGVYKLSGGREYRSFDATFVRILTDRGLEGWGESTPFGANYMPAHAKGVRAGIEIIAPELLGMDPRLFDRVNERMDALLCGNNPVKAALDIACWDIFAKSVELPVCDLLGGSTGKPMPVMTSCYAGDPDDMRERIREYREQGFRGHSFKIGATEAEGGPALDAERIKACLADRQPGEFFLADCNSGLTPESTLRMLRLLPEGLDFTLEAPCPSWREMMSVRQRSNIPLIWDEQVETDADIINLIATDAGDGFGLKITKSGGLTRSRRHRDIGIAAGMTMAVQDTMGSPLSAATIAHMAQTIPEKFLRCLWDPREATTAEPFSIDMPIVDATLSAPREPGLGATPNFSVLGTPLKIWS